jgi:hypothetical protein
MPDTGDTESKGTASADKKSRTRSSSAWNAFVNAESEGNIWKNGDMKKLADKYHQLTDEEHQKYVQISEAASAARDAGFDGFNKQAKRRPNLRNLRLCLLCLPAQPRQLEIIGDTAAVESQAIVPQPAVVAINADLEEFEEDLGMISTAFAEERTEEIKEERETLAALVSHKENMDSFEHLIADPDMQACFGIVTGDIGGSVQHTSIHVPADRCSEAGASYGFPIDSYGIPMDSCGFIWILRRAV